LSQFQFCRKRFGNKCRHCKWNNRASSAKEQAPAASRQSVATAAQLLFNAHTHTDTGHGIIAMVSERASAHPTPQQAVATRRAVAGPLPLTVAAGLAALWLSRSRREVDVGSRIRLKVLRCALHQQQTTKMRWPTVGNSPKSWSPVLTCPEHQWKFYYCEAVGKLERVKGYCCCSTRLLECAREWCWTAATRVRTRCRPTTAGPPSMCPWTRRPRSAPAVRPADVPSDMSCPATDSKRRPPKSSYLTRSRPGGA